MEDEITTCGIVMPISGCKDYTEQHWFEVKEIISESIISADFNPNLVSESEDSGIIHNRIVQNLYENEIVVCDVSNKNPNVMFELGLRLAFDKPTIIIKDEKTDYTFDAGIIEHLTYPVDLHYQKINQFKKALSEKITSTYTSSKKDPLYTTFLKHFSKQYTPKTIKPEELSSDDIVPILLEIQDNLRDLKQTNKNKQKHYTHEEVSPEDFPF